MKLLHHEVDSLFGTAPSSVTAAMGSMNLPYAVTSTLDLYDKVTKNNKINYLKKQKEINDLETKRFNATKVCLC